MPFLSKTSPKTFSPCGDSITCQVGTSDACINPWAVIKAEAAFGASLTSWPMLQLRAVGVQLTLTRSSILVSANMAKIQYSIHTLSVREVFNRSVL